MAVADRAKRGEQGFAGAALPAGLDVTVTRTVAAVEGAGNQLGERKMAPPLLADDLTPAEPGKGNVLAMGGRSASLRAAADVAAMPGTFSKGTSTEFSGSWTRRPRRCSPWGCCSSICHLGISVSRTATPASQPPHGYASA